eukprot:Sdes_comp18029_c0_seq2m7345
MRQKSLQESNPIETLQNSEKYLGCFLDEQLIQEFQHILEIDICGENGEYHTFVTNGPMMNFPLVKFCKDSRRVEGEIIKQTVWNEEWKTCHSFLDVDQVIFSS